MAAAVAMSSSSEQKLEEKRAREWDDEEEEDESKTVEVAVRAAHNLLHASHLTVHATYTLPASLPTLSVCVCVCRRRVTSRVG